MTQYDFFIDPLHFQIVKCYLDNVKTGINLFSFCI